MRAAYPFLILCLMLALATVVRADDPLFLQPPYDEIVLDESNGRAVLRVQPATFPDRSMPSESARKGDLEFELVDRPGEKFAVPWVNVAEVRFFERLVLAEADSKVKENRFNEAQAYFLYLEANHKNMPGLKDSIETFLYMQVGGAFRAQRYDEALALLIELYDRNPARQGASTAYERVTAELVKGHIAAGRYSAVRGLLRILGEKYPATKTTTVATYETQLTEQAAALLAQATAAKAASKPREAHEAVQKAIALWPTLAGASELARSLHQDYPVISVGVVAPFAGPSSQRIDDWASLRTSRLVAQPLVEPTSDGAYQSVLGELVRGEDPRQLTLKLRDDLNWATPPRKLTGHDVSRCLLAAADSKHSQFDPHWPSVLGGANVSGSEVRIDLLHPQPVPEAWLVRPLWWDGGPSTCGPYQLESHANDQSRFVRQGGYFSAAGIQTAEIVERTYPDSTAALRALRRGEISLIDRLSPWDVAAAKSTNGVSVRRYVAPTVHVLIVNPTQPLVASRTMRRALLYGIDRQGILRGGLIGGQELPGCDVVSGPFPRGAAGDQFGYGYDPKVEPRPYEPGTGLLLAQLAIDEAIGAGKTVPPLVLAYPAEPVARAACQSIARQLKLLNLQVTLKESKVGELPALADCDLLYAELTIHEPTVDAWRVLGPGGLSGSCSAAMLLALRQVESSPTPQEAAAKLQAVHRLAAAELPVIPLWQLAEHFAVHASVQEVAERPGSLYEGVQRWQAELRVPAE